jgi:hypothetical protein
MVKGALTAYELRRVGAPGAAAPALVLLAFAILAGIASLSGTEPHRVAWLLTAALEVGLPFAAGLAAAHITATEPAVELQLSLKTRYRDTLVRRLFLLVACSSLLALLWAGALRLAGLWRVPGSFLIGQLGWFAPLLWFVGAGALLALLLRARAASGAILGGVWLFENLFGGLMVEREWARPFFLFATTYTPGADYWLSNRLVLIATALVALAAVWIIASNPETLWRGGDERSRDELRACCRRSRERGSTSSRCSSGAGRSGSPAPCSA